jgi:hypothetical protein
LLLIGVDNLAAKIIVYRNGRVTAPDIVCVNLDAAHTPTLAIAGAIWIFTIAHYCTGLRHMSAEFADDRHMSAEFGRIC